MSSTLFWIIAAVGGFILIICLGAFAGNSHDAGGRQSPVPLPATPPDDVEPDASMAINVVSEQTSLGPHTVVARGCVDEGAFLLVRTPLWDYPFNRALFTQVFVDDAGLMTRARYCPVDTVAAGKLEVGTQGASPVTVMVGCGAAVAQFSPDPETTWTH